MQLEPRHPWLQRFIELEQQQRYEHEREQRFSPRPVRMLDRPVYGLGDVTP
jgi:hypothetical protein